MTLSEIIKTAPMKTVYWSRSMVTFEGADYHINVKNKTYCFPALSEERFFKLKKKDARALLRRIIKEKLKGNWEIEKSY